MSQFKVDEVFEAVVKTFLRLRPFGASSDPRIRGAALSDDVCMQAAARIVDVAGRPSPSPHGVSDSNANEQDEQAA